MSWWAILLGALSSFAAQRWLGLHWIVAAGIGVFVWWVTSDRETV